ncbi:hypothetical protein [Variovorax sp. EBFNA2]|uniref:hypothetical protein n=1 Tax=Variovorax sp. EBFNA2 TaxID=3342097 RepID=UPI0029BFEA66|nr:hypothetical protein [Variovorax boronicumulans]WPG38513.1 hypothetical protein RZE79_04040 [Variovorax boronicumulans]
MKKIKIIWIDDLRAKVEDYRAVIEAGSGKTTAELEFVEAKGDVLDLLEKLVERVRVKPPQLFIIDQVFNLQLAIKLKGSSVANLLRNTFPNIPMVCVTGMLDSKHFDQEDISEFTSIFSYQDLNGNIEEIFAIAIDFPKLHTNDPNVRGHVIRLLKAPSRDKTDLERCLPEEFQSQKLFSTTPHRIGRWINSVLIGRPGFLYDRLHAATLLGLTEKGFGKVENIFEKAKYKGIFSTEAEPRWWASELQRILFTVVKESGFSAPQALGRKLAGITKRDFSICYISGAAEPAPEAVAATDVTSTAQYVVVRRQFAEPHPNDRGTTPGIEDQLILKPRAAK